mmetsp:Transcript_43707/g.103256  ORF Transcript_43707/g.103256 Transcript_43707/m.103256 type:complete len:244 (+) Transcript_43707:61-792(+)
MAVWYRLRAPHAERVEGARGAVVVLGWGGFFLLLLVASSRQHLHLVEFGPELSRNEQTIVFVVVGEAVEAAVGAAPLLDPRVVLVEEAFHLDEALDQARLGVDDRDPVELPDVRVDLSFDVGEVVEAAQRHHHSGLLPQMGDQNLARLLEGVWVPEMQVRAPIAHDQLLPICRHAPAFVLVLELPLQLQRVLVVDESDVRAPRELEEPLPEHAHPLAEVPLRQLTVRDGVASLEGFARNTCAV